MTARTTAVRAGRTTLVLGLMSWVGWSGATTLHAEDWPQWRGRDRAGVWHERGILEALPETLQVTWRTPIGSGYAGPAVADGRVFVLDWEEDPASRTLDGTERVLALDEQTGDVLWEHHWTTSYRRLMASYALGPRATPTVHADRVYVVGATGRLFCLDTDTGAVRWEIDLVADYGYEVPPWGMTSAPLVEEDLLITIAGGAPDALVVAFDAVTGEERWRALDLVSEAGQAQPVIIEAGGARQLIIWHPTGVASLDPVTGSRYWEQAFDTTDGLTIATPVHEGAYLLVSQVYGGSLMLRLNRDRPDAQRLWARGGPGFGPDESDGLHAMVTTPIIIGDHFYGVGSYGELRGLDARTGDRVWMSDRLTTQTAFASAFMVRQGDRYFVNNDDGQLVLARFTPEGYEELDRVRLIEPTSRPARMHGDHRLVNWVHPAYANGHIVHRNDREVLRASLRAEDY